MNERCTPWCVSFSLCARFRSTSSLDKVIVFKNYILEISDCIHNILWIDSIFTGFNVKNIPNKADPYILCLMKFPKIVNIKVKFNQSSFWPTAGFQFFSNRPPNHEYCFSVCEIWKQVVLFSWEQPVCLSACLSVCFFLSVCLYV